MNELPLSILDTYELYTCSTRIYSLVKEALATDPYAMKISNRVVAGTTDMEKAMGRALKSGFTSPLLKADKTRDSDFICLRDHVSSCVHSKDAAKAAAATEVWKIITSVGKSIYYLGYADQTTKMNTLINLLSTAEAAGWLETIGATVMFKDMVTDQKAFEDLYKSKVDAEGQINIPLLLDSKNAISKAMNALLTYIDSNNDEAMFKTLEGKINEVITDTVSIARNRMTREEKEKAEAKKQMKA